MNLSDIRTKQLQQQVRAIATKPSLPVATYKQRDPVTGDRVLESGDGSKIITAWIARSNPQDIPPLVAPSGTIGLPGYAGQK